MALTCETMTAYCSSCSFFQHIDDHSIIMADQTVIKKGKCLLHICVYSFGTENHSSINLTHTKIHVLEIAVHVPLHNQVKMQEIVSRAGNLL